MHPKITLDFNEDYFMSRKRAELDGLAIMKHEGVEFVRIDGENYRLKDFVPPFQGLIPYLKSGR
ncbi:MAG: hypothetical protein V3R25_10185 [Nitrosomonadaceae bacterium]